MIMTHPEDTAGTDAKRYADALTDAANGVPHALDTLVKQLSPMLWRVARAQNVDKATAEDVVQNTWLSLMRSLSDITDPAALPGWLATTARREAWRLRKKGGREQPIEREWDTQEADQAGVDEDVLERVELAPRYRALWSAVAALPRRCRDLVEVIAYTDRPDYGHIAAALGMPRNSVGPNRGRCLAKLRAALTADPRWKI